MASQIIVYGPSLKSQILRLIVVHLWFRRWKQILRQWRGCCVVFNGSVRTRWKRSIRQCGSLKQNYVTRLIVTLPPLHLQLTLPFSLGCKLRSMIISVKPISVSGYFHILLNTGGNVDSNVAISLCCTWPLPCYADEKASCPTELTLSLAAAEFGDHQW